MSRFFRNIFNFFIENGILLALGPVFIVWSAIAILDLNIYPPILWVTFLLNYSIYALDRYMEKKSNDQLFFIILAIVILFFTLILLPANTNILILVLLFIGLLYNKFFKRITRVIPGFKSMLVSIMFPLPLLFLFFDNQSFNPLAISSIYLFYFLRLLSNTIFCDIKDIDSDKNNGLLTIPIVINNARKLNFLLVFLNFISIIPIIYGVTARIFPLYSLLFTIVLPYSLLYIYLGNKKIFSYRELANKWADGEFILWALLIMVFNIWKF